MTPGMRNFTAIGYGTLAPLYSDEEVMSRCMDKQFQKDYLKLCKEAIEKGYFLEEDK